MTAVVEFRDLSYRIGHREILRSINLSIFAGETVVLLGRSGSGKTTLLKTVNRLIEPTGGEIRFQEKRVDVWNPIELRRKIGYVIQDGGLFPHLTVEQNVGLIPNLEGWPQAKIQARTKDLLNAMGMEPSVYGLRYPRQLSGGEKQRVGIARALAADPPLLLLDEPFAALDPVTRFAMQRQFLRLIQSFRKSSIFVTHDIREALMLGSRVAVLKDGVLEMVAEAREFRNARTPEAQAFLATIADDRSQNESRSLQ